MRTFKVTLTEDELKAVIGFNVGRMCGDSNITVEYSSRIHELTKKLNKSVEVEEQPAITEEQTKDNASAVDGWG